MPANRPIVTSFALPARAAFRTEPVNADTSQRQKLSNFVVRMAAESTIPVDVLIRDLVLWPTRSAAQAGEKRHPFATGQRLELVNATGDIARYWSEAVNHLAGRIDTAGLTLLEFAPVLNDPGGLMTRQRRWCPACIQEDLKGGTPVYERLLWSIRLVTRCPRHDLELRAQCAACGYVHNRELTRRAVSGLCGRCHGWLGAGTGRSAEGLSPQPEIRRAQWTTHQLAAILDLPAQQRHALSRSSVPAMLDAGIAVLCDGSARQFARLCGKATSSLSEWRNAANFPSLSTLLQLSWHCGIPLTAWLTGDREAWQSAKPSLNTVATEPGGRYRTGAGRNWTAIGDYLSTRVGLPDYTKSLAATAGDLKVDPSELRRRFPDLAAAIIEKARRARSVAAEARLRQRRKRMEILIRELLEEFRRDGRRPTRRLLDAALRARGITVRHAEYPLMRKIVNERN